MTVREEAKWCIQQDGMLAEIRKKIRSGKATYEDTAAYSARAGKMIGALFSRRLPEIPPEEREQLCVELLHDQYIDINAAVDAAQRYLDERLGIQLAPQHAPFDSERGHQIGSSLRDLSKPVETLQRRAKAATETATKSMHDDRMKAESKFRDRAGLKCWITRKAVSGCCAWCTAMAGRFEYGEEPDDIYRRHDNCDCTVTFENGRQRQDVWSKREWEVPKEDAGAGERVVLTEEQAREVEEKHLPEVLTNGREHGTIKISGAVTGALDPDSDRADEHAKRYYASVRKMTTDVSRIAGNTGFTEAQIQEIKNFIFMDEHDLGDGRIERFEPSYMMAESWQRLIDGRDIQPHDLTLLQHEIMERDLMRQGYSQVDAHIITSKKYNYQEEARRYYDSIKKHPPR